MKKLIAWALTGIGAFATMGAAQAQMVTAVSPQSVVDAMQNAGYRAVLKKDSAGDPLIESSSSGSSFNVFFYGCTNNRNCRTVQFFSGYKDPKNASLSVLNGWNANNRFTRAYLADTGSARIEMDVDLDDGGMSAALFEDNLEFWVALMAKFERTINGG
ncbi:MAG TPA: YbjN domain-containing protein [Novosphingobium sp.]